MNQQGIEVNFMTSVLVRGRTPERVARTHQDGKLISEIFFTPQFITVRFFSEPTRLIKIGYSNLAYAVEWLEPVKVPQVEAVAAIPELPKRKPNRRMEEVVSGQT